MLDRLMKLVFNAQSQGRDIDLNNLAYDLNTPEEIEELNKILLDIWTEKHKVQEEDLDELERLNKEINSNHWGYILTFRDTNEREILIKKRDKLKEKILRSK